MASWADQKRIVLYVAASYTAKGAAKPALGTLKLEAGTAVALPERLVSFSDFKITDSNFPTLDREQIRTVVDEIAANIPKEDRIIALDRVLASVDTSQIVPKNVNGLKADPPVILYSTTPAVLVNLDGDPVWSPIKENDLKFAVNTNWDLFQHGPSNIFYLRYNQSWLQAKDITGPWQPASKLPGSFAKLPADDNWKDVRAALQPAPLAAAQVPHVYVSTKPAELILLKGAPTYLPVPQTNLLWLSNTESDVFRLGKDGPIFFLVSGRWFSAPDPAGPWTFATPDLPEDFKKIPLEHKRSRVLASVPGTDEAAEAVLLAQIPQTARVDKKQVKAPDVTYQGDPQFQPIESTTVARATNTDKDIIKVGDIYYMCFQGVWFMAKAPGGPWEVTGSVPKEIYEIPPSSPSYNVTHVTVVEDDDDNDAVVFATAAAFTGLMIGWGCAVWGTGYYYPPYVGYGGFYPDYIRTTRPTGITRRTTRGPDPTAGAWRRTGRTAAPASARATTREPERIPAAPRRTVHTARAASPTRTTRAPAPTARRGRARTSTAVGDRPACSAAISGPRTSRATSNRTGTTRAPTSTSGGGAAVTRNGPTGTSGVARTGGGDVYAGRDGNVYRNRRRQLAAVRQRRMELGPAADAAAARAGAAARDPDPRTAPAPPPRPTPTVGQLNRDSAARAEGAQRTRDAGRSTAAPEAPAPAAIARAAAARAAPAAARVPAAAADDGDAGAEDGPARSRLTLEHRRRAGSR